MRWPRAVLVCDFDLLRPKCVLEQSCANWKTGSIERQGGGYLHAERTPDQLRTASPTRGFQTSYMLSLEHAGCCIMHNQIKIKRKVASSLHFGSCGKLVPTLNLADIITDLLY